MPFACLAFKVLLALLDQAEGDWAIIAPGSKEHGRSGTKNAENEYFHLSHDLTRCS
jgi:hypothetical protein